MTAAKIQNRLTGIIVRQPSQQIGRGGNTGAVNIAGDIQTSAEAQPVDDYIPAATVDGMKLILFEAAVQSFVAGGAA